MFFALNRNRRGARQAMRELQRGYTLIEAVLVLMLGVATTLFAMPTFSGAMRSWQLISDTRSISTTLAYSKLKAISQATRYQIVFDIPGNGWTAQRFNRSTGSYENDGSPAFLSSGLARSGIGFQASPGITLPGFPVTSSAIIRFNSRGFPIDISGAPTGSNVLYLTNGKINNAISVSLTGRVELWRYAGSQWILQ
jgi:Tfp pilus assembly protein FimT